MSEYLLDQRPPLEAQLIDLADEIAYNTADLDDGFEAHLLSLDDIRAGVPLFERFYREVEAIYPDAADKLQFNETVKRMLDRLVGDLIQNTAMSFAEGVASPLWKMYARHPDGWWRSVPKSKKNAAPTRNFLYRKLYFSPTLSDEKVDAGVIIKSLFAYWMRTPDALPQQYQEKAQEDPLPRVVCDYIAGMTDTFIYEQYERFCSA